MRMTGKMITVAGWRPSSREPPPRLPRAPPGNLMTVPIYHFPRTGQPAAPLDATPAGPDLAPCKVNGLLTRQPLRCPEIHAKCGTGRQRIWLNSRTFPDLKDCSGSHDGIASTSAPRCCG